MHLLVYLKKRNKLASLRVSNPLLSGNKYTTISCLAAVRGWCFVVRSLSLLMDDCKYFFAKENQ